MTTLDRLARPGIHETRILEQFGERALWRGRNPMFNHPLYLLAFVNRSGSNLLAEYLRTAPPFAGFHEHLNHDTVARLAVQLGATSFPDYLRLLGETFGSPGRIFGYKASWDQAAMLFRFGIHRMYRGVRVIHILRNDTLGQAISFHIAAATRQWTSAQEATVSTNVTFHGPGISELIDSIHFGNQAIEELAHLFNIPRLRLLYEELVNDPKAVITRIGRFSGHDLSTWKPVQPSIRRQASELNDDLRAAYRAYAVKVFDGA